MGSLTMSQPSAVFQIKVTLRGSKPPIWRRVQIASDTSLQSFHHVLQRVMGWYDCHLHLFLKGRIQYGPPDPEFGLERQSERRTMLHDVLRRSKDRLLYEYDFGDGWQHDIVLERVLEPDPAVRYPVCIAGKRACPPEDCGGVGGFYDFLEAVRNPTHPGHAEMLEWYGSSFDPSAFDLGMVNRTLPPARSTGKGPA